MAARPPGPAGHPAAPRSPAVRTARRCRMTYSTKHEWYKTQLMKNIVCSHFYIPATCYDDIFGEAPDRCLLWGGQGRNRQIYVTPHRCCRGDRRNRSSGQQLASQGFQSYNCGRKFSRQPVSWGQSGGGRSGGADGNTLSGRWQP